MDFSAVEARLSVDLMIGTPLDIRAPIADSISSAARLVDGSPAMDVFFNAVGLPE
ncbi:hypothetical protein [Rhodococcus sp. B10]|uniref:hypothetical protein n=1 Tax=Rhodococcus sp. B10 TaxID=2695876 RepID=UPI001430D481|nr:hypothetical protein [Rhodococcus sp. B10]